MKLRDVSPTTRFLVLASLYCALFLRFYYATVVPLDVISRHLVWFFTRYLILGFGALFWCMIKNRFFQKRPSEWYDNATSRAISSLASALLFLVVVGLVVLSSFVGISSVLVLLGFSSALILLPASIAVFLSETGPSIRFPFFKGAALIFLSALCITFFSILPYIMDTAVQKRWAPREVKGDPTSKFEVRVLETRDPVITWSSFMEESSAIQIWFGGERTATLRAPGTDYTTEYWATDDHVFVRGFFSDLEIPPRYGLGPFKRLILRFDRHGNEEVCADVTALDTFGNIFEFKELNGPTSVVFSVYESETGSSEVEVSVAQCHVSEVFTVRRRVAVWTLWKVHELRWLTGYLEATS